MNKILVTLLILSAFSQNFVQSQTESFTVEDLKTVFKGALYGIGEGAGLEPALECVTDAVSEGKLIYAAIEDLKTNDSAKILEGIKLIGQALESLPKALTDCKAAVSAIEKLVNLIKSFTSPTTYLYRVEKDLIVNGVQIFDDVKGAVSAFELSPRNYYNFGFDIGNALEKIFIGQSQINLSQKLNIESESFTVDDLKSVFKGALYGIEEGAGLELALECVKDAVTEGKLIYSAVEDLESKDSKKVLEGIKLVGQALESLPNILKECKAAASSIENLVTLISSFTSPASYLYRVEKDIIVNGVQIFDDIKDAVSAFNSSPRNYYQFGFDIGNALEKIFIGKSLAEYAKLQENGEQFTLDDLKSVFKGVLYGIGEGAGLESALECVKDAVTEGKLIYSAVEDLESKDSAKVLEGIKLVGQALESLPNILKECKAAVSSIENLVELISSFTSPASYLYKVEKDIIVNGVQIFEDIKDAVSAFNSSPRNYYQFGFDIGNALEKIFIGKSLAEYAKLQENGEQFTLDDLKSVFKGVLYGIGEGAGLEPALECVTDAVNEGKLIYSAIEDLKTKDSAKILEGIKLIGQALESLPQALKDCKAAVSAIEKLVNLIKSFTSPTTYLYRVEKDLVVNGVQIFDDVKGAVTAFESTPKDYYNFGYDIGNALEKIFIGVKSIIKSLIKRS